MKRILLAVYATVNKSGLLKLPPIQYVFEKAYFQYKKRFEDPFANFSNFYPTLFSQGNILDVGANIGYTAQIFSEKLGPDFQVHAFEPDQANFSSLTALLKKNRYKKSIVPVFAAIGETSGSIQFWYNEKHHADHRVVTPEFSKLLATSNEHGKARLTTVPMLSLDEYVERLGIAEKVTFVKVDVQGFELPVLRGMRRIIESNPTLVIAVEYAPLQLGELGFEPSLVLNHLQDLGFQFSLLTRKGILEPIDNAGIERMAQTHPYFDLVASRQKLLPST